MATRLLKKSIIGFLCLFAFSYSANAQQSRYDQICYTIDSLANVGLPKSALAEVNKLDSLARKNNNAPQQIRAAIYRMTFQSYIEENGLVAIINRLKQDIDRTEYPAKPVLQSILAETYWNYFRENSYKFHNRTRQLKPDSDFTKWDSKTIIDETSRLYELSIADAGREQATPISALDGVLEGDSTTRNLRPTLYDLLVQRTLDFYFSNESYLTQPKLPFSVDVPAFFSDSRSFAGLSIKTNDTASLEYRGMIYLQRATRFHLEHGDKEALADLDLQRLKFVYDRSRAYYRDSLYVAALEKIAKQFSSKPISADALVLEGQYYQGIDSLVTAHSLFEKAQHEWPGSLGGKNAATLLWHMEEKMLQVKTESAYIPNQPILAQLIYRNLNAARAAVYKLSSTQFETFSKMENTEGSVEFLKKIGPMQLRTVRWDTVQDFQSHTLEFKVDSLQVGTYVLMLSGTVRSDSVDVVTANFEVSNLACTHRINPDGALEVLVTDRLTGKPIKGAKVEVRDCYGLYNPSIDETAAGKTDKNGILTTSDPSYYNIVINTWVKGDTLLGNRTDAEGATIPHDTSLPRDETVLFTDRQIYRPGQTVYFKALQLYLFQGGQKIETNKELEISLYDVNNKQVGKLNLKTNDFGTLAGSFVLPQSMLGGSASIRTVNGSVSLQVEEYKRPSFHVDFLPSRESHKLNDSITIAGNVKAFSGYGLSNARVAVRISRTRTNVYQPYSTRRRNNRRSYDYSDAEILADTIATDNFGHFKVKFKAIPGRYYKDESPIYKYHIAADVTDESGETHQGLTDVPVSNNDIKINWVVPGHVFAKDTLREAVSILNLNGELLAGKINIEAYALKSPGELFKSRVWESTEQYEEGRDDFKRDFPGYAYKDEDMPASWPAAKKVLNLDLDVDTAKDVIADMTTLNSQPSGIYRLVIHARSTSGDTLSETSYINIIHNPPAPHFMQDWVMPEKVSLNPGDAASLFVGINKKINVLEEFYSGPRLIFSKWLAIDTGIQKITIPVSDTLSDPAVQFIMIYQNRAYKSGGKIELLRPDKTIKLKFMTFRNKLQPGQKEEWKLQLSGPGNKKTDAELLAGMYDASLDDIYSANDWPGKLNFGWHYTPNYFTWNTWNFVNVTEGQQVNFTWRDYTLQTRDYERINLLGYNYYGSYNRGYHRYLDMAAEIKSHDRGDVIGKGGRTISGVVLAMDDGLPIPAAVVKVKGTSVGVQTGTNGRFTIFVPAGGKLVFSDVGFTTLELSKFPKEPLIVKLFTQAQRLGEVVVTGALGVRSRSMVMGYSTATIDNKSLKELKIEDAETGLQGKASGLQINTASNGVDPSTRIILRGNRSVPVIPRTNFNETAFFYPQLHTDEKGQILIDFTIPEALTRWKFRGLAHTRDLESGYIEAEVVTQKQLSISANTPRFLREGDTITISARLANLTSNKLKGKVHLQLFNAVNMQPVNLLVNKTDEEQNFSVDANTNKGVSFKLAIPFGLDALDYRLTADAGDFTDGEENTLPVLTNRTLVIESMPMMVRSGQTKTFTFNKLMNQHSTTLKSKTLTLEYTSHPAWYAVQALPYMMEYPYECSEQVFSRYFANSLATDIVNKNPVTKKVFDQWKSTNSTELLSNLEKNPELKATLLEETPWLQNAQSETEQKRRIGILFDLNRMSDELNAALDKLQKRQQPGGGFTWYGGNYTDRYMTQHILEGMGELEHLHIGDSQPQLQQMSTRAIGYVDDQLLQDEKLRKKSKDDIKWWYGDIEIHAWFARSYFPAFPMTKEIKETLNNYLAWAESNWTYRNVYEQAMIALTLQRYNKSAVTAQIEKSLLETAQQSDELGMYWAKNQLGYYWYEAPIETQSLLIELFTEAGDNAKAVDEMKIWLLRNKQTNDWGTTKATASACYALLMKGSNLLADTGVSTIKLGGKSLAELKPEVKTDGGTGYLKTSWNDEHIKPDLGKVEINNTGKTVSWGALHWQYLENLDKITSANTNIRLRRKYFIQKQTDAGAVLTEVDATHQPKVGDLLKVVVYLDADRDFEYVQLKDMRPAGTEPVDAISTYKYQDGLWYYQVTKDVATNFFISELSKGSFVFEYRLRVAQPGNFSTGITSIQCMYAPEFNAHSEGGRMVVKP